MTRPTLAQVVDVFHELYPPHLAEGWDKSGLIAGRAEQPVERVLFAVDAVQAVAQEAVDYGASLLITHHPLLLRGANFLPASDYKGNILHTLIEGSCGLLAAHTNADSALEGANEALSSALGLTDLEILTGQTVQVLDGQEYPAGLGRVGNLPAPMSLADLAEAFAKILPPTAQGLRIAGKPDALVTRVALCSGAGDSLFDQVRACGADVYLTSDLRHHPASELREQALLEGGKPYLIDSAHAASEWVWLDGAARRLHDRLAERGFSIETRVSELNTDPWDFTVSTGQVSGSASTSY